MLTVYSQVYVGMYVLNSAQKAHFCMTFSGNQAAKNGISWSGLLKKSPFSLDWSSACSVDTWQPLATAMLEKVKASTTEFLWLH